MIPLRYYCGGYFKLGWAQQPWFHEVVKNGVIEMIPMPLLRNVLSINILFFHMQFSGHTWSESVALNLIDTPMFKFSIVGPKTTNTVRFELSVNKIIRIIAYIR